MRVRTLLPFALAALAVTGGRAPAQDEFPFLEEGGGGGGDDGTPPADATDDSTPDYRTALELQRKGKWRSAMKAFVKLLEKYPNSVHRDDARLRSEENHFAGVTVIHESGPPSRRIDVSVMGDGFTYEASSQKKQEQWANLCLDVLWSEASFEEYKDYFNYYFVRLVSEDEKVDPNITDAQKAKIDEKNKRRSNPRKYDYSTALDCKAAGPQGQVMADRALVYKWLGVAANEVPGCSDDGLVIAFAQFGQLGMGGGGVANVGRPDKSVTVHEFGHAFSGLLDEYTNNPTTPQWAIRAPNATSDREDIPWQHFLDAKVKGVEVIEGGATYVKGVWRPAKTCAMNAAGATGFCPVCREANVLAIYRYVNPIDAATPLSSIEMKVIEGDEDVITVTPMQPKSHDLEVTWYVERVPDSEGGPSGEGGGVTSDGRFPMGGRWNRGERAWEKREHLAVSPLGELSKLGETPKRKRGEPLRHTFPVGELPRGRWVVTVAVKDTTDWVLKDENYLLEDREAWWVTVAPRTD